jgi:hypothetical protein
VREKREEENKRSIFGQGKSSLLRLLPHFVVAIFLSLFDLVCSKMVMKWFRTWQPIRQQRLLTRNHGDGENSEKKMMKRFSLSASPRQRLLMPGQENDGNHGDEESNGENPEEKIMDASEELENSDAAPGTQTSRGLVDLVELVPFAVKIAVTDDKGIRVFEVSNIVTDWINEAFQRQLEEFGYTAEKRYAAFDSVVLFNRQTRRGLLRGAEEEHRQQQRRALQEQRNAVGDVYTAKFKGGAVFSRDAEYRTKSVPVHDVLVMQQMTLLNDTGLLAALRDSPALGLGAAVVDVNAFLDPTDAAGSSPGGGGGGSGDSLEIVIIVAIVVACVAFMFLVAAIYWAYRYDRSNRRAYLVKDVAAAGRRPTEDDDDDYNSPAGKADQAERPPPYPREIGGADHEFEYPESVISDSIVSESVVSQDVSASLSQYYRAGMGKVGITSSDYGRNGALLSDAGSVSSMESYGYSLDGTMPSMATPVPGDERYCRGGDNNIERIGGLPVEPDLGSTVSSEPDAPSIDEGVRVRDFTQEDVDRLLAEHAAARQREEAAAAAAAAAGAATGGGPDELLSTARRQLDRDVANLSQEIDEAEDEAKAWTVPDKYRYEAEPTENTTDNYSDADSEDVVTLRSDKVPFDQKEDP